MKKQLSCELISREDAYRKQLKIYFTGQPCRNGHVSPRYVTTSGCLSCLRKYRKGRLLNAFSHDLIAFEQLLWISKRVDPSLYDSIGKRIQVRLDEICLELVGPVCKKCDGTKFVVGAGDVRGKPCPICNVSSAPAAPPAPITPPAASSVADPVEPRNFSIFPLDHVSEEVRLKVASCTFCNGMGSIMLGKRWVRCTECGGYNQSQS